MGIKMRGYVISCGSPADLTEQHFLEREIKYVCFHFQLNGKDYLDDLGKSISIDEFYKAMKAGADSKTSQVNAEEYERHFEQFLKEGKDVLHLCLSSGISGDINSALIAKQMMEVKYPERKIYVVDSLAASSGYGMLMDKLADLRDDGMGIEELYNWVEENKLRVNHWFFSTDLTTYIRGGRISKTAGAIGGALEICPLLNVDHEGRLISRSKVRKKRKVIQAIVDRMEENAEHGLNYADKCYLSHSACIEDAEAVVHLIEEKFHNLKGKIEIFDIGTTIGCHTGVGTVALFYWGKIREN